jgi:predicted transcriptional regulator
MPASGEYRDRPDREVAVLDALVDRGEGGMTVLELRSRADLDIDEIEAALESLKTDGLIEVETAGGRTVFTPAERVLPDPGDDGPGLADRVRDRLPF